MNHEPIPADADDDRFSAAARAAGIARADALKVQAAEGGLHFRAYLPPALATWLLDKIATGTFVEAHKAHLDMVGDVYVLRAGSLISATATDSLPANVGKLRAQLLAENALVPQDGCLRLTKDIAFTSPSPASALVKGRSSTGHGDLSRTTDRKRLGDVLRER